MKALAAEVRTGIRSLGRQPAFTVGVILTFALGLGINAAMFSFLDRVYLRPPTGVVDPGSLRRLWTIEHDRKGQLVGSPIRVDVDEANELATAFGTQATVAIAATQPLVRFGTSDDPPTITIVRAAANYLPLLGVRPAFGRFFTAEEASQESPAKVAVISYDLWHSQFAGDSSILGRSVKLSDVAFTIIGVAQRGFAGIDLARTDAWVPLSRAPVGFPDFMTPRGVRPTFAGLVVRLASGATDAALETRTTTIIRRLNAGDRDADSTEHAVTGSIIEARGPGQESPEVRLSVRLGAVAIAVLLIACTNIVNLLLARAVARRREIAVRLALGCSRLRLAWLLAVPIVGLALVAGIVAASSGWVTASLLGSQLAPDIHFADAAMSWRVIVFTLSAALAAGVVSAALPAIQATRTDITTFLKAGPQHGALERSALRSVLIGAQAALSLVLLVGAGLFLRSVIKIESLKLGYDVPRLTFASFADFGAPDSVALARAAERIRSVPGVERVALVGNPPLSNVHWLTQFYTATDSGTGDMLDRPSMIVVSPEYFATTGVPIVHGRAFDASGDWSIIVNETMARQYWPRGDALGQCVRIHKPDTRCYTVVGIAKDVHRAQVIEKPGAYFYLPAAHPPGPGMRAFSIVIRADESRSDAVAAATRRVFLEEFPGRRSKVTRMEATIAPAYRPFQLGARLFSMVGLLALVVAAVGIYSNVSYTVAQRTHEFGVRIALGAGLSDVSRVVLSRAITPVGIGVFVGLGIAIAASRLIASLLYDVSPTDVMVYASVSVVMLATAVCAALIPAARASRVDPMVALRAD
jgi:predicted permease